MQRGLIIISAAVLTALTACSNSNSSTSTTTTAASPAASTKIKNTKVMGSGNGASVYNANCSSCHQSDGKGAIGPPLAGNSLVTGDPKKVIHIVKNGLTGKVVVNGKTFNGMMPAWKTQLSNADIASVISYIRSSWGNSASAVTSAQVASTP